MKKMEQKRIKNRQPNWKKQKPKSRELRLGPLEVRVINGDIEQAIKILDKKVGKDGVLSELKRRRFVEKPSEKRRRKKREAIKKARKALNKKRRVFKFKKKVNDGDNNSREGKGTNQQSGRQERE